MITNKLRNELLHEYNWEEIYGSIKPLFLCENESNLNNIIEDIQTIFSCMPKHNSETPYLGTLDGDYSFLRNFEMLPNLPKDKNTILAAASQMFSGMLKWHHPHVMHNVNPSPMISTVAIGCVTNIYNPNPLWDFVSAGSQEMEQQIVRQMATLAQWEGNPDGVFTFGGKGCLTYAIRIGLNRCLKDVSSQGLTNRQKPPVVITSEANHYSIDTACSLVGIGYNNCRRIKILDDETLDIRDFELSLKEVLDKQHPVAAIIISGGNTLHLSIDNLYKVNKIINKYVKIYDLNYKPYVYFDTVVGWPMLFYRYYDFNKNPMNLSIDTKKIIKKAFKKINAIKYADGFGIDFHKTGFCPYSTSLFMTKNGAELHSIHKDKNLQYDRTTFGGNFLQHHTIEHSRSAAPIISAWVSLQTAGIKGYQSYLSNHIEVANEIRAILPGYGFELINPFSLGFASIFAPINSQFCNSYFKLIHEKDNLIEEYNQYTYQLFLFLQKKEKNGSASFILRFLPQYRKSLTGRNIAVIVVYPMAMSLDKKLASKAAKLIGEIKINFDEIGFKESNVTYFLPTHVPK